MKKVDYTEEHIKSLNWREHIRLRPGMYVGKLGDGSQEDDGIYILFKEILDNAIDEHIMGFGNTIECHIDEKEVRMRDYGRGIPLGKLTECVSKINTGGKYENQAFRKSVGLNGVGAKVVNALSGTFEIQSFREKKMSRAVFQKGLLVEQAEIKPSSKKNGTEVRFIPDNEIFTDYQFQLYFIEEQLRFYSFLNTNLSIYLNKKKFFSQKGLVDLLEWKGKEETFIYPIVHIKEKDIEVAFTHTKSSQEVYFSFVNSQHTLQGGTHLNAFKEGYVKTIRTFFNKNFEATDIRSGIFAVISITIEEPVFESQTKTKLGSIYMEKNGITMRTFINQFLLQEIDNVLHKDKKIADSLKEKILESQKERKEIDNIKKIKNNQNKKVYLHNKKLKDCKYHLNEKIKNEKKYFSTLFITEGDSASGSITKARDAETQAVFSLRGKPLNSYGMGKKIVYQNEEFYLLQNALNIENGIENLRYKKIIISTDADVDGMHIRLLLITFFLQFFPKLIQNQHLFLLETPLFRVRDNKTTLYCYSEKEKEEAIRKLKNKIEITRFKGLGELSPNEFEQFIGKNIRTTLVSVNQDSECKKLLRNYMGKNTPERQEFIIKNLRVS